MQDPSSLQFCLDTDVQDCGGQDELFCLNTVTFSASGAREISVSKTCATESVCRSSWYDTTRNIPECLLHLPTPAIGQPELRCSYCCNASDTTGAPCNVFDRPVRLMDFSTSSGTTPQSTTTATSSATSTPVTTTTATTTTAPTTTMITTTVATTTTTTPQTIKTTAAATTGTSCAVCDNLCIFFQEEQPCSKGFCMTSVTDDDYFSRVVTKSCVTEDECYKRWWQETSDQSLCLTIRSQDNNPSGTSVSCNFCCYGDKCNSPDFPTKATLYNGNNRGQYHVG
ncbi:CUB domain-containing protein-like [Littorina saxatilis]|uniref:CUB domain-containing protein-like n=1 Tax=Littorina saxatilis TaxID=31220 RepID=UPI0038B4B5EB